ncbi:hypothetical protein BSL78_18687 [Apostichopus japonicus]|uniref:Uncharacterized protein n=1 Tax=Stichopus japonicus TaxID=307972 RepID=A0A2G8K901_STIJA|nr:hypothetical protein BSL78_18687 [Apostichopus japonicus]
MHNKFKFRKNRENDGIILLTIILLTQVLVSSTSTTVQRDTKDARLDVIPPNGLIEKYFNEREKLDQHEDHLSQRMNELIPEERNVWRDLSKLEKYHKLHYVKRLRPNEEDSTKELEGAERKLDQHEDHPSQRMNELIPEERNVWRDLSKLEKYHKLHYVKRLRPNEEDSTKELEGAERLAEPIPEKSSPLRNIDNELDLRVANYITNYLRSEGLSAGAEDVLDRDEDLPEPQRRFLFTLGLHLLGQSCTMLSSLIWIVSFRLTAFLIVSLFFKVALFNKL